MRVKFWTYTYRDRWQYGFIVRYVPSPFGDYAEIAPDAGGRVYLYRHAVEGWEPLWVR